MKENKNDLIDIDSERDKIFQDCTDLDLAIERQFKRKFDKISEWQANCEAELRSLKKKLNSMPIQNDEELQYITGNIIGNAINCKEDGGEI